MLMRLGAQNNNFIIYKYTFSSTQHLHKQSYKIIKHIVKYSLLQN